MKKILFILCCFVITHVNATEMCARDDTVVVPLDAVANASGRTQSNTTEYMWSIPFSYGNIYGTATLLSRQEIAEFDPSYTVGGTYPVFLPTDNDEIMGRTGTDANGNIRDECFIKMTHPMSSKWLYVSGVRNIGDCFYLTVNSLNVNQDSRSRLFNAVLE